MSDLIITKLFENLMWLSPSLHIQYNNITGKDLMGLYSERTELLEEDYKNRPSFIWTGNSTIRHSCKEISIEEKLGYQGYLNIAHPNAVKVLAKAIKDILEDGN